MAVSSVSVLGRAARNTSTGAGLGLTLLFLLAAPVDCGGDDDEAEDAGTDDAPSGNPNVVLDGGGDPAIPPEGEELCAAGECNYQSQQGCGAGETCAPLFANGQVNPGCGPIGSAELGDVCQNWTDCAAGLFCAEGACRKLCCGADWTACPTGQSCIRQLLIRDPQTQTELDAGVDLCFPVGTCDVLDTDSCAAEPGRTCQIVDPVGNVACARAGSAKLGDSCGTGQPCAAGMSCVGGICRQLCRAVLGVSATGCKSGESCVHYRRDPPDVGECTPLG